MIISTPDEHVYRSVIAKMFSLLALSLGAVLFFSSVALADNPDYIVDSPLGGTIGTGKCTDADPDDCTFEDAIAQVNANPNPLSTINLGIDDFILPATYTIPISAPITISEPVTIDGYMQWTATPNSVPAPGLTDAVIRIVIDGSKLGKGDDCITVNTTTPTDAVLIKGLAINGCPDNALTINGSNKTIQGNYIGTDSSGTVAVPNGQHGIYMNGGPDNLIGGPNPEDRNVISGNTASGILFTESVSGSDIEGNFIGLDATGSADLGNGDFGIIMGNVASGISHSGNTIGNAGLDVGDGKRNYISGNASDGIFVALAGTTKAFGWDEIRNNYIGTDVTGAVAIPNDHGGVGIAASGDVEIEGNLISGNGGNGVSVSGDAGTSTPSERIAVYANNIGTDAGGTNPLGNSGAGVLFHNGTNRSYIGDSDFAGSGNVIAYNTGDGVVILEEDPFFITDDNKVQMNSIFGNGELGIDLASDGVTLNDALDADTGANHLQNFPIVESVTYAGGNTTISGSLNSIALRDSYRIELFSNDSADTSGYGEGEEYLGAVTGIDMDALGDAVFSLVVAGDYSGKYITATVTDKSLYTSEFGPMTDTDLSLAKTVDNALTPEDETVTFTITLTNNGPSDATDIYVSDALPAGITFASYAASQGTYNSGTGEWNVGNVANGGTATLTIQGEVNVCTGSSNTATISRFGQFDSNTANDAASIAVQDTCPIAGGRPDGYINGNGSSSSGGSSPQEGTVNTTEQVTDEADPESGQESPQESVPESVADENNKYCPYSLNPVNDSQLTRYEFVRLMLELNCYVIPDEMPQGEREFTDFRRDGGDDSMDAVLRAMYFAYDNGIISGYPDGSLKPLDPINHAEAAKIVFNATGQDASTYKPIVALLPDFLSGNEWFFQYYLFMLDITDTGSFAPADFVSRQDAELIVDKLMEMENG